MVTLDIESYTLAVIELIGQYLAEKGVARRNPCDNTGAEYENDVFHIQAYDWREEDGEQMPNFWYKPLNYQVEWYKHAGRGTFANRPMDIDTAMDMLDKCIASLQDAAAIAAMPDGLEEYWEVEEYEK